MLGGERAPYEHEPTIANMRSQDSAGNHELWNVQVQGLLELLKGYSSGLEGIAIRNAHLRSTISWYEALFQMYTDMSKRTVDELLTGSSCEAHICKTSVHDFHYHECGSTLGKRPMYVKSKTIAIQLLHHQLHQSITCYAISELLSDVEPY